MSVVSFTLPVIDGVDKNTTSFDVKDMDTLKDRVSVVKNKYDAVNNNRQFIQIARQFDYSRIFKHQVHKKYNAPNVSNAWLKAYELVSYYKVIPTKADNFVYFDNAAFPGSFILAINHYVKTMCDIKHFKWYGSSMISTELINNGSSPLGDSYRLYVNYKDHWLMDKKNNGDVTVTQNQREFARVLGGKVDLYTSDLGFDVSLDYNRQEETHAHANLGQIITALLTLKEGGTMMTKQYSYFEAFTISLMGVLTHVFDKIEICKPMFSKAGNSETYLIGIGYKSNTDITSYLLERLENWSFTPLTSKESLGDKFITRIVQSQKVFTEAQILTTNRIFRAFNYNKKYNPKDSINKWILLNPLKKISNNLLTIEVISR